MDSKNIQLWKDQLSEISKKIQGQQAEGWMTRGIIVTDNEALDFVKKELDYDTLKQLGKVCELDIDASWSQCMTITPEDNATGFRNKMVKTLNRYRDGLLVLNVTNIELFKLCWHLVQLVKNEQENELYAWCSDELFDLENGFLNIPELKAQVKRMREGEAVVQHVHAHCHRAQVKRMREGEGKTDDEIREYFDAMLESAAKQHLKPSRVKFTGYVLINASALNWDDVCDYARDNNKGYFQAMLQAYSRVIM